MPKIILTRGIQGSGKSTWAKKWVEEDSTHRVRWNNEDFRKMLGPYLVPEREYIVQNTMDSFLNNAMSLKYNIVLDDMNFNPGHWAYIQEKINYYNSIGILYELEFKDFFDVPLEECIERDSRRENPIGKEVIINTYNKYRGLIEKQ